FSLFTDTSTAFGAIHMSKLTLQQQRKWFALALAAVAGSGIAWHLSPGLPVLFGPRASASAKQAGYELFVHEWQPNDPLAHGDGLGPVFNEKSCVACHNQGGVGGGGDNSHNVNIFMATTSDGAFHQGAIHGSASEARFAESFELVRQRFPVIPGTTRV